MAFAGSDLLRLATRPGLVSLLLAVTLGCAPDPQLVLPPLAPEVSRIGLSGGITPAPELNDNELQGLENDLAELGTLWLRHPGLGTSWVEIQPDRETWDFERLDSIVEGIDQPWVLTVYGQFGYVYPFGGFSMEEFGGLQTAEERTTYIAAHTLDMSDEQQREDAETYVRALVRRYQHLVRFWEVGNEGLAAVDVSSILELTHRWIKEEDPSSVVLLTAVAGTDEEQFDAGLAALDSLLSEGAADFFDVGNYHYYGTIERGFEERLVSAHERYAALLEDHGIDPPIWVTETSTSAQVYSTLSGPSSDRDQACHVTKRFVLFTAHGAQRVFWHNYRYGSILPGDTFTGCSLYTPAGERRPAWDAMQLTADKIGHFQRVEIVREADISIYRYEVTPGEVIFVVWAEHVGWVDLSGVDGLEGPLEYSSPYGAFQDYPISQVKLSGCPLFIEPKAGDEWMEGE